MLFLCDVFDRWLDDNNLPHWSADDILYGENACKLTGNQKYWLESFYLYLGYYQSNSNAMEKLHQKLLMKLRTFYVEKVCKINMNHRGLSTICL